jgi:hypothetical protein
MFYINPGRELTDIFAGTTSLFCERHEPLQSIDSELLEPDPARQVVRLCAARAPSPAPRE